MIADQIGGPGRVDSGIPCPKDTLVGSPIVDPPKIASQSSAPAAFNATWNLSEASAVTTRYSQGIGFT
jgi:hypothetical protein